MIRRLGAILAARVLFIGTLTGSSSADQLEDCPAFERGVSIAVRKANGTYSSAYSQYRKEGLSVSSARKRARGDANFQFWRSLRIQARAIADYSTDPVLFFETYTMAARTRMEQVGNAFGRAMSVCDARLSGRYPRPRLAPA
mgnify:FL=1